MLVLKALDLEIFVVQPLKIYPNVEICQIYFHKIEGDFENYKSDKYRADKKFSPLTYIRIL